ncbi:hypothetical protein [Candidatus Magnetomonas plexicatena]|uniref:hypothetical protein n=1 Tax=Candidatus Magnetomonas plexicatena TaxID=2552947 RepID=UPI001C778244|nr:hypothetical protein E2O03_008900 [Nitrospirales bacterium LBB_01]
MVRKSLINDNIDLAYQVWRDLECDFERSVKELNKKFKFRLTTKTLKEWAEKYKWKERSEREDLEIEKLRKAKRVTTEALIGDLLKQKEKYDSLSELDNQSTNAYKSLINTINNLYKSSAKSKLDAYIDVMRIYIQWLVRNDPDGATVVEKNMDEFTLFLTEKYG